MVIPRPGNGKGHAVSFNAGAAPARFRDMNCVHGQGGSAFATVYGTHPYLTTTPQ